mmetsp:Transcript_28069/g.64578  ORF Transcript_28069/g.64578 Transcript_28069/m.64578 type:complete len:82 (+) Transcript_28069:367-612(+)
MPNKFWAHAEKEFKELKIKRKANTPCTEYEAAEESIWEGRLMQGKIHTIYSDKWHHRPMFFAVAQRALSISRGCIPLVPRR